MSKLFTILTASYNTAIFLDDWAKSIMDQTYRPLEVVCVDDRSTDGSFEILESFSNEFKKKDIQFKLLKYPNKLYCGSAYNKAIKNATGNYFGILDSDDMLEPFACSFIANIYEKRTDISWIYTQHSKYNKSMSRIVKKGFCKHPGGQTLLSKEMSGINCYSHWRTFSDRILSFKDLFGSRLRGSVDKHLGFRLEELGTGMFVNKICYKYRRRSRRDPNKSIVSSYPIREIKDKVMSSAKKRRCKSKCRIYPIIKFNLKRKRK